MLEQQEMVKCDVCGLKVPLSKNVASTWVSQIFMLERTIPSAQVTTAEVHCPPCASSFNANVSLLTLSATSQADIN